MLDKTCDVCGTKDKVEIETVTNVNPVREEMFPVLLCQTHKKMLAKGELDIRQNDKGDLVFVNKKKS
jgi:hypothetical protein